MPSRSTVCAEPGCPNLRPCAAHTGSHTGWTSTRDREAQARFRAAILARDAHRCVDCGATENLRACHTISLSEGGSYHPDNGVTRCVDCDRATDSHAR